jgi:carboxymethylenebutenolidase
MPQEPALTAGEQKLDDVWNEHLRAEFSAHSPDETIVTMAANPLINQVPVMIGGDGREEVYEFYTKYFLPQIPADAEMVPVSRTIGQGRLVNEMIFRFTQYDLNGLDAAWHPADRKASRDSDDSGRAI